MKKNDLPGGSPAGMDFQKEITERLASIEARLVKCPPTLRYPEKKRHHKAFSMYMEGMQQKEISAKLGVSEKTVCQWAAKYEWKDSLAKVQEIQGSFLDIHRDMVGITRLLTGKVNRENRFFTDEELKSLQSVREIINAITGTI